MDAGYSEFVTWLREKATAAGYNPDVRGSLSALAEAAGTDVGMTSRALRGMSAPMPSTLRSIAKAINVPVLEMFVRAEILRPEDVAELFVEQPDADRSMYATSPEQPPSWEQLGAHLKVPDAAFDQWLKVVKAVTGAFQDVGE